MGKFKSFHSLYSQFMNQCHQKIFEWYPIFAIILFLLLVFPEDTFNLLATLLSTVVLNPLDYPFIYHRARSIKTPVIAA